MLQSNQSYNTAPQKDTGGQAGRHRGRETERQTLRTKRKLVRKSGRAGGQAGGQWLHFAEWHINWFSRRKALDVAGRRR